MFHGVRAPRVLLLADRDADDAGRAERLGLVLQALDRELARVVERVRVRGQLAALRRRGAWSSCGGT